MHASCIQSLPTPLKHDRHIFLLFLFLRPCLSISAAALISLSVSNKNITYDKPLNLWICQPGHVSLLNNTRPYQQSKASDPSSLNRDRWPLAVGPKQGVRLRGGGVRERQHLTPKLTHHHPLPGQTDKWKEAWLDMCTLLVPRYTKKGICIRLPDNQVAEWSDTTQSSSAIKKPRWGRVK